MARLPFATNQLKREGLLLGALIVALLIAGVLGVVRGRSIESLLGFAGAAMPNHVSLLFVGDIMLDRYIRELASTKGYDHLFSGVSGELHAVDMVIGNLEGPITTHESVSYGTRSVSEPGHMRFTFATSTAEVLRRFNIETVSLGNNHILDFGREGYEQTIYTLERAGVAWFGGPYASSTNVRTISIDGVDIALVAYNQFLGGSVHETARAIAGAKRNADVVIVFAHWGEEYVDKPSPYIIPWARQFVDAGADLVIGAHPHVPLLHEEYRGVRIYYSLGNFIFDQYWMKEVRCGLGVRVDIEQYPHQKPMLLFTEMDFGRDREGNTFVGCK